MRARVSLLVLALLMPACASSPTAPTAPPVDAAQGLNELADVYKYRVAQRLPAPTRLDDLADNEASLPNAWPAIQDGRIIVLWKFGLQPSSGEVLAYEKDAPTAGGSVLLRSGTVKKMTAAEFAAAPKAK